MEPPTGTAANIGSLGSVDIVSVFLSSTGDAIRKDFHCCKCGRICFNYYGNVRLIYMGEVGIEEYQHEPAQPHDIMCSRCKKFYRVN